ncbi:hypothetical protein BH10ACT3_BH10ACT3_11720 [soil metagenome]
MPDTHSARTFTSLDDIIELARPIVESIVWATATTVDVDARPRNRIVHPVLAWTDPPTGWITSRPTPLRVRHLAANPYVSLSYWSPAQDCVYVDCDATWVPGDERADVWERILATPEPIGFDPASIWPDGPDSDDFGVISLTAHRIRVVTATHLALGEPQPVWRSANH